MSLRRSLLLGTIAGVALAVAVAGPALADHNAGADLADQQPSTCYYGALLYGPPVDLQTDDYVTIEHGGSLTIICRFTTRKHYEGTNEDEAWNAPNRLIVRTGRDQISGRCLPPGVESAGEVWPGNDDAPVPDADRMTVAFYRTTIVLTCHWNVTPLPPTVSG